jgi:hypothetical protein
VVGSVGWTPYRKRVINRVVNREDLCRSRRPKKHIKKEHSSMAEMLVQESGDLSEGLLGLGHAIVELILGM